MAILLQFIVYKKNDANNLGNTKVDETGRSEVVKETKICLITLPKIIPFLIFV